MLIGIGVGRRDDRDLIVARGCEARFQFPLCLGLFDQLAEGFEFGAHFDISRWGMRGRMNFSLTKEAASAGIRPARVSSPSCR